MPILPENLIFKKQSPFYSMIATFKCAICGLGAVFDKSNPLRFKPGEGVFLRGKTHKELIFDPFNIYQLAQNGEFDQPEITAHLCCMLVNTAYASAEDKNDKSPLFEFFRHIRNAGSHGNKFYFKNYEPLRKAEWRSLTIDHEFKGGHNQLQNTKCFNNLMATADLLLLLWDIDQKYN